MDVQLPKLQTKTLRRAPDPSAYKLYRAAQEWDLVDPILIRDREDLKSEPRWHDHIEPYYHQISNLVTFCRRLPVTLLADDVGLGKTISAGLIASELMARHRVSKILVVCPKLLMPQWKEELETKFAIPGVEAVGNDLVKAEVPGDGGAIITTYQSARMYLDALSKVGFEMLILDEAHKLRNLYGTNQPPQVAEKFRDALANRTFKYVLMLTATPLQNRLWDIYSLVDLLSVARGHQNPFGSEGMFARTFIADDRTQARQLAPHMRDSFRSIVYGYMSRIRRADANLHFPERIVQLHKVDPEPEEQELIKTIAGSIESMDRLSQISILQAVVSSPNALLTELKKRAAKGTVPQDLATRIEKIVGKISITAKLRGLASLVERLQAEQPERWRLVVFTRRLQTQTSIESFLQTRGIACGLINGDSGERNQRTIAQFRKPIPEIHVIVSTEAGSEGVNLQAANVLVNFDLPWNPMIVEQRIGRIQRLASEHASVCICNIILRGTFEEHIVGRLMEKLQLASHAIGDIEALLEAANMNEQNEDGIAFEELIRQLAIASLAGKDIEATAKLAEESIAEAKVELQRQEKNIDAMFGKMEDAVEEIPYPHLPAVVRSMGTQEFVLAAMASLGTPFALESDGVYRAARDGKVDRICFDEMHASNAVLYRPGTPAFSRLVTRMLDTGLHRALDLDEKPGAKAQQMAKEWVEDFGGNFHSIQIDETLRSFGGIATVRVRATVGHDSYERLVDIDVSPGEQWTPAGLTGASPIADPLKNPEAVGINSPSVAEKAAQDPGVAEFCRFYLERRTQELTAAGADARKRKKVEDDFTPRLDTTMVGIDGNVRRQLQLKTLFDLGSEHEYESTIAVIPAENKRKSPELYRCPVSQKIAPTECFARCGISGLSVLKHLLVKSEVSDRAALPEFIEQCAATGKRVLQDELEESSVTHHKVLKSILKTSDISGKRAEPQLLGRCEFSGALALIDELDTSTVSGKKYRKDRQQRSIVSGKTGYRDEFVRCTETGQTLLPEESEKCDVTGKIVIPGALIKCEVSNKRVLPSLIERSALTGKCALKEFFVSSSVSGIRALQDESVASATGEYCLPTEAKLCMWSGNKIHPDDLRSCDLTRMTAHFEFMTTNGACRLEPLVNLLNGLRRKADKPELWPRIADDTSKIMNGKSQVEAAILSPSEHYLAVCLETKNWLGLKTRQAGLLYAIPEQEAVGRIVTGKRGAQGWALEKAF
jgi:superfamily II DNA or RNA helicase